MITISTQCSFASYNASTLLLTSAICNVDADSSLVSGADAPVTNNNVEFCSCRETLVAKLKAYGVKNPDGSEIIELTEVI